MTTPRWLSANAWPIGISLIGLGISWGILSAAVHGKADAQTTNAVEVRVGRLERESLLRSDFREFMIRDSLWKERNEDRLLGLYCEKYPKDRGCNP